MRAEIEADLEADSWREAHHGWGPRTSREKAYKGTLLRGLSLSIDAGDHPEQLTWRLEVAPSQQKIIARMTAGEWPEWSPSKGHPGWFWTALLVSSGKRKLTKRDMESVVALGRTALRRLHLGTYAAWSTVGPGSPPAAGHDKSIPQLRAGIRDYEAVGAALKAECRRIVAAIASPDLPAFEADVARRGEGWVTRREGLPRVWAGHSEGLSELYIVMHKGGKPAWDALEQSVEAIDQVTQARFPMRVEQMEFAEVEGPGIILTLTEESWQAEELTTIAARVVENALKSLSF